MSTGNIVSIENVGVNSEAIGEALGKVTSDAVIVTFSTRHGGVRRYRYTGSDAIAIRAGADPANYDGERVL